MLMNKFRKSIRCVIEIKWSIPQNMHITTMYVLIKHIFSLEKLNLPQIDLK